MPVVMHMQRFLDFRKARLKVVLFSITRACMRALGSDQ